MPYNAPGTAGKKIKYVVDQARGDHYIRAWTEGRGRNREVMVQVWKNKKAPEGEPDGDWAMPGVLGIEVSIAQSIMQTPDAAKPPTPSPAPKNVLADKGP